eukprot:m.208911 g.208911  ORF g.208911 m.208911 type:complete len:366 (-) comp25432_c2_seq4:1555-2652(-)
MAGTVGTLVHWAFRRVVGAAEQQEGVAGGQSPNKTTFRIGSRKSKLAMIQTEGVMATLQALNPTYTFELHTMETIGDKVLDVALSKIGTKNLFTRELEVLLVSGDVDLVVHSLKDLPTTLPPGLALGAICEREDPRDAVIFRADLSGSYSNLASLPAGSVVGTSSLRRTAQLLALYPELVFESVRGNLNTRLKKLDSSTNDGAELMRYSALVLAAAGIHRMGWKDRIGEYLDPQYCPYAVSQGSVGIECREGDRATFALLRGIGHKESTYRCIAERACMRVLEGGCSVPIGVFSKLSADRTIHLRGAVHSLDGKVYAKADCTARCTSEAEAEAAGLTLARHLNTAGAKEILDKIPRTLGPTAKPT